MTEPVFLPVPVTRTTVIFDKFIFIPLALVVETIVILIWFGTLYRHTNSQSNTINEIQIAETVNKSATTLTIPPHSPDSAHNGSEQEDKSKSISTEMSSTSTTVGSKSPSRSKSSLSTLEPIQKWWSSMSFTFGFLFCCGSMIFVVIDEFVSEPEKCIHIFQGSKEHSTILLLAAWQRFTLYSYFILRTYLLFKGTAYSMSYNRIKCYLITLFTSYIMVSVGFLISALLCKNGMFLLMTFFSFMLEMYLIVLCLRFVIHRLFKLYHSSKDILGKEMDKTAQKRLQKLIHIATKITVLALLPLVSTNINVIIFGGVGLSLSGTAMDTAFNTICLLLTFAAFEKQYKSLCKCCDKFMLNWCQKHDKCVQCCCCIKI